MRVGGSGATVAVAIGAAPFSLPLLLLPMIARTTMMTTMPTTSRPRQPSRTVFAALRCGFGCGTDSPTGFDDEGGSLASAVPQDEQKRASAAFAEEPHRGQSITRAHFSRQEPSFLVDGSAPRPSCGRGFPQVGPRDTSAARNPRTLARGCRGGGG